MEKKRVWQKQNNRIHTHAPCCSVCWRIFLNWMKPFLKAVTCSYLQSIIEFAEDWWDEFDGAYYWLPSRPSETQWPWGGQSEADSILCFYWEGECVGGFWFGSGQTGNVDSFYNSALSLDIGRFCVCVCVFVYVCVCIICCIFCYQGNLVLECICICIYVWVGVWCVYVCMYARVFMCKHTLCCDQ